MKNRPPSLRGGGRQFATRYFASVDSRGTLGDQAIELDLETAENLVVLEVAELVIFLLEIDGGRPAPQSKVGVVGLAGTVHPASHNRDRDLVLRGVGAQHLDLLRELDELFVLDPRA